MKFKPCSIKHAGILVRQKGFSNSNSFRVCKLFFNENNVPKKLQNELEQLWDQYWVEQQLKEGEKNGFKRGFKQDKQCKKAG